MVMTLITILGDVGPSLVLRIDIHQMKIITKLFPCQCTAIFMLHYLIVFKYCLGLMESTQNNNKTQRD